MSAFGSSNRATGHATSEPFVPFQMMCYQCEQTNSGMGCTTVGALCQKLETHEGFDRTLLLKIYCLEK